MKKYDVGKLYKIRFYDHSIGIEGTIICEVVGFVIKDDPANLLLSHWLVVNQDEKVKADNLEPTSILKCCIIRSRKY